MKFKRGDYIIPGHYRNVYHYDKIGVLNFYKKGCIAYPAFGDCSDTMYNCMDFECLNGCYKQLLDGKTKALFVQKKPIGANYYSDQTIPALVCKDFPSSTECKKGYVFMYNYWIEKKFFKSPFFKEYYFRDGPVPNTGKRSGNCISYHRKSTFGSYKQSLKFSFDYINYDLDDEIIVKFNNNHQKKTVVDCGFIDFDYNSTRPERRTWKRTKYKKHQWDKRQRKGEYV